MRAVFSIFLAVSLFKLIYLDITSALPEYILKK